MVCGPDLAHGLPFEKACFKDLLRRQHPKRKSSVYPQPFCPLAFWSLREVFAVSIKIVFVNKILQRKTNKQTSKQTAIAKTSLNKFIFISPSSARAGWAAKHAEDELMT